MINSRDMGIQCFLDLGIFAIFLFGMWDIFSKYLKGYGILGSPTPSRASIVFLRVLACLRASFSPLNCTKTIFCHMASPMDPYRREPPDPLKSAYSIKCLRKATDDIITKALTSLHGCTGLSGPLLFSNSDDRVSRVEAQVFYCYP